MSSLTRPAPAPTPGGVTGVVQHLARSISRGELRPGERLPSERAMSERFGISRQSVRKVVSALADAGIIAVESGRGAASGAYITSSRVPVNLLQPNRELPSFSDVARVLEARRLFEPPVALLASMRMDDRDYDAINEVLELQRQATDLEGIRSLDIRFHLAIADATHNSTVRLQMETFMQELDIARHVVSIDSEQEAQETIEIHERTLAALISRDPQRVTRTMDEHLSMMEEVWERTTGRRLSPQTRRIDFTMRAED